MYSDPFKIEPKNPEHKANMRPTPIHVIEEKPHILNWEGSPSVLKYFMTKPAPTTNPAIKPPPGSL
jgi:hypothetical protein